MKILFLIPYPIYESPSQRFRFEQYFSLLTLNGISYSVQSFLTKKGWRSIFQSDNILRKATAMIIGLMRRMVVLAQIPAFDFVFIHREVCPFGPPVFEWIIAHIFRKKIIYDFDDAIWATDKKDEGQLEKIIRWRSKIKNICRWSYKVSCGNDYLCSYASKYNRHVILNPTTIDTRLHTTDNHKKQNTNKITIGWTGSHSTLKYLREIVPVIQTLELKYPQLQFLVIANQKPVLDLRSLVFLPWSVTSEIEDLIKIDIGIMPLPDDEWSKGKCGFKILQYMALEIPALASPVGVNNKIIDNENNGFLCGTQQEWLFNIEQLINNDQLRLAMGMQGRSFIERHYSVSSNSANFLSLFA